MSITLEPDPEPHRDSRRLHSLRGWSHGPNQQVLPRDQRASGPNGAGAPRGACLPLGDDQVHFGETRLRARDVAYLGRAKRTGPGPAAWSDDRRATTIEGSRAREL